MKIYSAGSIARVKREFSYVCDRVCSHVLWQMSQKPKYELSPKHGRIPPKS